jgi:hypothetical protein
MYVCSTAFGPHDQLTVSLWDKDRFTQDDFLGQVPIIFCKYANRSIMNLFNSQLLFKK